MNETSQTVLWVLASIAFLKALSTFANFVSGKTKNKTDDKIAKYLGLGIGFLGKIIDQVIGNSRPK